MKLQNKPRALLALIAAALATNPNDDAGAIAIAKQRDAFYKDAALEDETKDAVGALFQAALEAPVTAAATAANEKFGKLGAEQEDPAPAAPQIQSHGDLDPVTGENPTGEGPLGLHRGAPQNLGGTVTTRDDQGGLSNPVLPPNAEMPTETGDPVTEPEAEQQSARRGRPPGSKNKPTGDNSSGE